MQHVPSAPGHRTRRHRRGRLLRQRKHPALLRRVRHVHALEKSRRRPPSGPSNRFRLSSHQICLRFHLRRSPRSHPWMHKCIHPLTLLRSYFPHRAGLRPLCRRRRTPLHPPLPNSLPCPISKFLPQQRVPLRCYLRSRLLPHRLPQRLSGPRLNPETFPRAHSMPMESA